MGEQELRNFCKKKKLDYNTVQEAIREKEKFNGYVNWETFNCYMWLSNDEYLYTYCRGKTAEEIKEQVIEMIEENGQFGDGITMSNINDIDFNDIAKSLNEE